MATLCGSYTFYFYLHIPFIHELGVLIPFMLFEVNFLVTANFSPTKSHPISGALLGPLRLHVATWAFSLSLGILFFYSVKILPTSG